MIVIHKIELQPKTEQEILLPADGQFLSVISDNESKIFLYYRVNLKTANKKIKKKVYVFGTGQPLINVENISFLNTVYFQSSKEVYHVFISE